MLYHLCHSQLMYLDIVCFQIYCRFLTSCSQLTLLTVSGAVDWCCEDGRVGSNMAWVRWNGGGGEGGVSEEQQQEEEQKTKEWIQVESPGTLGHGGQGGNNTDAQTHSRALPRSHTHPHTYTH